MRVFDWTPAERRGVAIVALLLAIGTVYDLVRGRGLTPAPVPPAGGGPASSADGGLAARIPPDTSIEVRGVPAEAPAAQRVDLNRATIPELDALPGIGPVLAGRIVAYRHTHGPYRAVEDLLDVPGIGPTLLGRLRDRVRIGGS